MITHYRPKIRSRHPSHDVLRNKLSFPLFPFKSVIRLGSFTKLEDIIEKNENKIVELNTIDSIKNSADKLLMKQCFTKNNVKTAQWFTLEDNLFINHLEPEHSKQIDELPYPIIAKHRLGSKGRGNYKLDSLEALKTWLESRQDRLDEYIFERFYNYVREYRLHVTKEGCFYTCRKMLKSDTPNKDKWYRNDDHCVWIVKDNEQFDEPICWEDIVTNSVNALNSTGLDFGAVDVKVQSATDKKGNKRKEVEFIIIEINSAPSFGNITEQKYLDMLPQLLLEKNKEIKNQIKNEEIKSNC